MNILDTTNRSWEAFLATTSSFEIPVLAAIHERDADGCLTVTAQRSVIHSTASTTIVSAPATGSRVVVGLTVLNIGPEESGSAAVRIRYNDSGTLGG